MKQWEELIQENVFGLGGHRDRLPACLAHMLYCVVSEEQYNLANFFVKRIECAKASPTATLSYGMFLTRLYRYVMETYPHLDNGTYDIVERVMRHLALRQTRRPLSDRGKARRSVSSSSSHHQGTSSHQHDDDDDDDVKTSQAITLSPTTYLNSLNPLDYQNYQMPSSYEQTDETLFARQTTLLNQTQRMHEEIREGFKSFGKALKGVFRKKKNVGNQDKRKLCKVFSAIREFVDIMKKNLELDEPTQGILDITARGIFLYKSLNQAFQFLEDKVLFEHDWSTKSQNDHHQKPVSFTDESDSNTDNSQFMEKLKAMDSQIISLNEELQDMRDKYIELRNGNASKNNLKDDTLMCKRHEADYIQSKGSKDKKYHDSHSHQTYHDPNDPEKSLTKLNNDMKNDLKNFRRRIRSMRTVHWKLFAIDDGKTTGVLPSKESKTVNQEPQSKTDLEKSITKFLNGQRVTNMTEPPPPPQAHTEHSVFTGSGMPDDSPKTQKDPPPPIIVDNKIEGHRLIKTSKKNYYVVETKQYPFREYIPKTPYPQRLNVDHSHLNR
nr:ribosomal protein L7Ae/L30e/S12e/Gadd45 [Tanacetum cinerariifolium]